MFFIYSKSLYFLIAFLILLSGCSSTRVKPKSSDDKNADLYYQHGTSALVQKKYTDALDKLLQANRYRSEDARIHNNLGMAYYFKSRTELAKKHFLKSLSINPKNSDARNNLASLYFKEGNILRAKAHYQKILDDLIYRHQYRTYFNLGLINLKEGRKDLARKNFIKATQERSDYCTAFFKLGQLENQSYNYHKALEWFKKGTIGTCVEIPEMHYQQAVALYNLKRYQGAVIKFQEVIEKFSATSYAIKSQLKVKEMRGENLLTARSEDFLKLQQIKRKFEAKKSNETLNSPTF